MLRSIDERRRKIGSAAAVAALHALLGYFFLTGLGVVPVAALPDPMKLFDAREDAPPPPPPKPPHPDVEPKPRKARPKDAEGSASPANLRDTPSEIVAPKPVIVLPPPPPIPAAPVAGAGNAPAAGAATIPGPGTGAGGLGTGLGSGLSGNGTGGGGGGGIAVHARWLRGGIDGRDYPRAAYEARAEGITYVRFTVGRDGRIRDCTITRSSGHPVLDETTCRLILRRFRYRPAFDADGRPVEEEVRGQQDWELGPERPPVDVEAQPYP
jgi:protein TonB